MLYVVVLLYILILVYYYDYKKKTKNFKFHYRFLLLVFVLITGLSYRLGIDLIRYEENFESIRPNFNQLQRYFINYSAKNSSEPLWIIFNIIIKSVTDKFYILHLIVGLFFNTTVFWFFKKYSPAFFTSVFLFAIMSFFHFNFGAMRESISLSFILIAISKIIGEKPRYIKFYMWIIPALLFHRFAFVVTLLPFVKSIRKGMPYFIVIALSFILSVTVITEFISNTVNFAMGEDVFTQLDAYMSKTRSVSNINAYIALFIFKILPIYLTLNCCSKENSIFVSYGLVYLLLIVLSTSSILLFYRVADYVMIPAMVALSDGINNTIYHPNPNNQIFKSKDMIISMMVLFLGYNIYTTINSSIFQMYYPYSSVIEKRISNERELYYTFHLYY